MYRKPFLTLAVIATLATSQSGWAAETAAATSGDQPAEDRSEIKAYFLHIEGRALPLKQALVNGVNVLGGPIISLNLPINISGYTKAGLNNLMLDYKSDPKSNLTVIVEKRTPGPKTEEIAKVVVQANDSKGAAKTKTIAFNLPADGGVASVGDLSDSDKKAIKDQFERYYKALSSAKADQVRSLFRQCIADERKLCPESAKFYDNVLSREVAIIKNKDLKLNPLNSDGLAYKVEGDVVKLYREDHKPLVESNEVDAEIDQIMVEIGPSKAKAGKKTAISSAAAAGKNSKQSKTKDVEIQSADFKPNGDKAAGKNPSNTTHDGVAVAHEVKLGDEHQIFDGSKSGQSAGSELPVQTAVRERLVRRNLYFKPSKPDSSGKRAWSISLPPNV